MLERLAKILDGIDFSEAEVVNCHLSLKDLGVLISEAKQAAELLLDRVGAECTLVVPSFAFAPFGDNARNYDRFVSTRIEYDVVRTPCYISLFGEVFRRFPGVVRSLNPLYPVAAIGPRAEEIIEDSHLDLYPFAPRTCYGKLVRYRSFGLGLGLDINTNPFIHLIDREYPEKIPYPMYSAAPLRATIRREGEWITEREYLFVPPSFRRKIRPRLLKPYLQQAPFLKSDDHFGPWYWLELAPFVELGLEMAWRSWEKGIPPPWHRSGADWDATPLATQSLALNCQAEA